MKSRICFVILCNVLCVCEMIQNKLKSKVLFCCVIVLSSSVRVIVFFVGVDPRGGFLEFFVVFELDGFLRLLRCSVCF